MKRQVITFIALGVMFAFSAILAQHKILQKGSDYYFAGVVVAKFQNGIESFDGNGKANFSDETGGILKRLGMVKAQRKFKVSNDKAAASLGNIIEIEFNSPADPHFLARKISRLKEVIWAEPHYLHKLSFTPNDDSLGSQWYLQKIAAESAWDVTKGDSTIIIGIVDSGVDWDHPDLANKIWNNSDETENGSDDDNNGFVDDVRGWDFGSGDNDPMEDAPIHGTLLAGLAAAETNNSIGIAGVGYNCTIMPVKVTVQNDLLISNGLLGIQYAADNGAKVISCSWGNYTFSFAGQEIVNYASSKGALVVAATGNDGKSTIFYPAAYDGVLAVGSSGTGDAISSFSNYGMKMDVAAPGENILSTWQNDTYSRNGGTSLATPIVSGIAGLVWSKFPSYSPQQVAQQIRVSADDISAQNSSLTNFIGYGRVNANSAVTKSDLISARATEFYFADKGNGNGIFEPGESGEIGVQFHNYLNPTTALVITVETANSSVTITNGSFNAGAVGANADFDNSGSVFTFTVDNAVPLNTEVKFLFKFTDGAYSDYQWATLLVNPTYATQNINNLSLTITSTGRLGFNDYPDLVEGNSLTYKGGDQVLVEGGLIIADRANHVMDAVHINYGVDVSTDFNIVSPFTLNSPGIKADQQGHGVFNDDGGGTSSMKIETELNTYSFSDVDNDDFTILEYVFSNKSGAEITNFYASLFFDWDINLDDWEGDQAVWDATDNFAYANDIDGNPVPSYFGCALVNSSDYKYYMFTNGASDGSIDPVRSGGFIDFWKWTALSGTPRNKATGDIAMLVGGGPYTIPADSFLTVAFAIAGGDDLNGLRTAVQNSRTKYNTITSIQQIGTEIPDNFSLSQNYPNPFNPVTKIRFSIAANPSSASATKLTVYNSLGQKIRTLFNKVASAGTYEVNFDASELPSGVYLYKLQSGNFSETKKLTVLK